MTLTACLAVPAANALAQPAAAPGRGELLYATHCVACHDKQIHWRERKLATDWPSLVAQVTRWQHNTALGWSGQDIDEVARYLNRTIYRFPSPPPPKG